MSTLRLKPLPLLAFVLWLSTSLSSTAVAQNIEVITGHRGYAAQSQFVNNSNLLITSGMDKIIIWDIIRSVAIKEFPNAQPTFAVSSNGKRLAFATLDGMVEIWDLAPIALYKSFKVSNGVSLCFSDDSQRMYLVNCDDTYEHCEKISGFDVNTGKVLFNTKMAGEVAEIIQWKGNLIVGGKNTITVVDANGNATRNITIKGMNVIRLALLENNDQLAVYSDVEFNPSIKNKGTVLTIDLVKGIQTSKTNIKYLDFYRDIFPVGKSIEKTEAFISKQSVADQLAVWYKVDGQIMTDVSPVRDRMALDLQRNIGVSFWQDAPQLFSLENNYVFRVLGQHAMGKEIKTFGKFLVVKDEHKMITWDLQKLAPVWEANAEVFDIDTTDQVMILRQKTKDIADRVVVTPAEELKPVDLKVKSPFDFYAMQCGQDRQVAVGFGQVKITTLDGRNVKELPVVGEEHWTNEFAWASSSKLVCSYESITYGYKVHVNDLSVDPPSITPLHDEKGDQTYIGSLRVSPDGTTVGWIHNHKEVFLYDIASRKKIATYTRDDRYSAPTFTFTHGSQLALSKGKTLSVIDYKTGKTLREVQLSELVSDVAYNHSLRKLFVITESTSRVIMIDEASLKPVITMLASGAKEYWAYTTDGYFKGSRNCAQAVVVQDTVWKVGLQTVHRYFRPDIVIERANLAPANYIKMYRRLYGKQSGSESGVSISMNVDSIPLYTQSGKVNLKVKCAGPGNKKLHIQSNDIQIFGAGGLNANEELNIALPLFPRDNLVKCHCSGDRGQASEVESFTVYSSQGSAEGKIHYVGLASGKFSQPAKDLKFAKKDIVDMTNTLTSLAKFQKMEISVDTLFDNNLTVSNLDKIRKKLKNTTMNDLIIVHYSGHGLLDDNVNFYVSTGSTDFDNPVATSIPYSNVVALLDSVPSMRRMMLIDACNSGEFQNKIVQPTGNTNAGAKGVTARREVQEHYYDDFLAEYYSNNVANAGSFILAATSKQAAAYELEELSNGIFTYSLIVGLKNRATDTNGDGVISVSELQEYVNQKVYEISKFKQRPSSKSENLINDFVIRRF